MCANFERDRVTLEYQFCALFTYCLDEPLMSVAKRGDSVATVQIENGQAENGEGRWSCGADCDSVMAGPV